MGPISLPSSPELISTHSLCQLNVASDRNKHQISLCEKGKSFRGEVVVVEATEVGPHYDHRNGDHFTLGF